jgi:hypothetical protein
LVAAPLRAAWRRLDAGLRRAAARACLESAGFDAAERPSRARARLTARDLRAEVRPPPRFALDRSRFACFRVRELAPRFGGGSFTPARLASESPMAMACLVDRAPCFPSRMWCISWRTNSPACVDADLPSFASRLARSTVSFSGIFCLLLRKVRSVAPVCQLCRACGPTGRPHARTHASPWIAGISG